MTSQSTADLTNFNAPSPPQAVAGKLSDDADRKLSAQVAIELKLFA